jgi:hypothetical protein
MTLELMILELITCELKLEPIQVEPIKTGPKRNRCIGDGLTSPWPDGLWLVTLSLIDLGGKFHGPQGRQGRWGRVINQKRSGRKGPPIGLP